MNYSEGLDFDVVLDRVHFPVVDERFGIKLVLSTVTDNANGGWLQARHSPCVSVGFSATVDDTMLRNVDASLRCALVGVGRNRAVCVRSDSHLVRTITYSALQL